MNACFISMDGGRGGKGGGCGGTHTQSAMSTLEILGGNHDSVCLPPPPQRVTLTHIHLVIALDQYLGFVTYILHCFYFWHGG